MHRYHSPRPGYAKASPRFQSWARRSFSAGGKRGIQYAAASRRNHNCLGVLDRPVKPGDDSEVMPHALRASAPSIMLTAFCTPYTATKEPKRGPFSWPSSTW
ncbi:hypothetical protein EAS54_01340 [Bradyrhizobium guangzhouense]|nr:hypothetical protein EAS54_01340 [Bradyrhizobium guangzhouense]